MNPDRELFTVEQQVGGHLFRSVGLVKRDAFGTDHTRVIYLIDGAAIAREDFLVLRDMAILDEELNWKPVVIRVPPEPVS